MKNIKNSKYLIGSVFPMLAVTLLLTGCAEKAPDVLEPANHVVEKPVVINPPDIKMNYSFNYDGNPALKKAYQQYLKSGKAPNIVTDGFEQFAYGTGSQPVIAASPLELTVISLEPGEAITNVSSGDPLRWSYSMAYSGQTKMRQAHVMLKPSEVNISTDLVITTDKRLYTLKLVSSEGGKYVRDVRFWYPAEMQDYWNNYNSQEVQKITKDDKVVESPDININTLNFGYKILHTGWSTPSWQPTRVFDDGAHTYIQFPDTISSRDMPALFIVNGKSEELVNYRSKPPYFVVDKIFQKAVLLSGGSQQITLLNNHY